MVASQLAIWPELVEDRPRLGRPPRSRWETQELVVRAGEEGVTAREIASERGLQAGVVRRQLRRLEQLGRALRVVGKGAARWCAARTNEAAPAVGSVIGD